MFRNYVETLLGAAVLAVALGFLAWAYGRSDAGDPGGYTLRAKFDRVDGLETGGDVRISGIKVGRVLAQELDPATFRAQVTFSVRNGIELPADSSAAIVSSGLLGGKYLSVAPGGDDRILADGGEINLTQSSVNLEDLIGRYIFGGQSGQSGRAGRAARPGRAARSDPARSTCPGRDHSPDRGGGARGWARAATPGRRHASTRQDHGALDRSAAADGRGGRVRHAAHHRPGLPDHAADGTAGECGVPRDLAWWIRSTSPGSPSAAGCSRRARRCRPSSTRSTTSGRSGARSRWSRSRRHPSLCPRWSRRRPTDSLGAGTRPAPEEPDAAVRDRCCG